MGLLAFSDAIAAVVCRRVLIVSCRELGDAWSGAKDFVRLGKFEGLSALICAD